MNTSYRSRIEVRPNWSLTPRGVRLFLLSAGVICMGPALALLYMGFWPALPFAGLEFAALSTATWWSLRKSRYREVIEVSDARVTVEKIGVDDSLRTVMPLHWCRAVLKRRRNAWGAKKLVLQTGMQECEVASFCTDSERVQLWSRLHALIGPINQSPQPIQQMRGHKTRI